MMIQFTHKKIQMTKEHIKIIIKKQRLTNTVNNANSIENQALKYNVITI